MSPMSDMFGPRSSHKPDLDELARYVVDALDPERKGAVEAHVSICDACAEALAREASVEAAFAQVALLAAERHAAARVVSIDSRGASAGVLSAGRPIVPEIHGADVHARLARLSNESRAGRRSRWAGGVGGALAAAAALVLAFASATARSEPASGGVAQRAPGLHDAAGDMSGAFGGAGERVLGDTLDGG
jgi:hypothetical protein